LYSYHVIIIVVVVSGCIGGLMAVCRLPSNCINGLTATIYLFIIKSYTEYTEKNVKYKNGTEKNIKSTLKTHSRQCQATRE